MSREICITWEYPQYAFTYVSTYGWRYINCHNHSVQGNFNTKEAKTPKKWWKRGFFILLRKIERNERKWYFSDNPVANYLRINNCLQIIPRRSRGRKLLNIISFCQSFTLRPALFIKIKFTRSPYEALLYSSIPPLLETTDSPSDAWPRCLMFHHFRYGDLVGIIIIMWHWSCLLKKQCFEGILCTWRWEHGADGKYFNLCHSSKSGSKYI